MKNKKEYKVKVRLVFEGEVSVLANSKNDAKEIVDNNLGLVLGGNIHSDASEIKDWDFPMHPYKEIK
ncbi:MAG: hypothetical protein IAA73_07480 [Bacteroidetes bacterium]|uniref:Uncharacterized protein n=1 Tax=Candidatus Gallipaludibacter merdavium TaxID=2840839 RepID=A0A9D9HTT6_9BACT|nr:hypothetical protein [Candidatus Gallipaludibacter merdavium]